jgi:hypothetical protein
LKTIPLTRGMVALVDDEDYVELSKHKWYAHCVRGRFYAARKNKEMVYMHRVITRALAGQQVDHHDTDSLNDQKFNLRICTNQQNSCNKISRCRSSKYKGVYWSKHTNKWVAQICQNYKSESLGLFEQESEAAKAYDREAIVRFGNFARLNFPDKENDYTELNYGK